ncbi:CAAX farnesyltransferase (FTase) subunit beta [Sticta canariensis]|nr:CAAX farnesyltransferase (FTase) subunit beta [Sticta canariensis]
MPPSIKVIAKRRKVLFKHRTAYNNHVHDLRPLDRASTSTSTTTATGTATATTTTTRAAHQSISRLGLGKGLRSEVVLDDLAAAREIQNRIMDPAGIGQTSDIDSDAMLGVDPNGYLVPELFTSLPPLKDSLETKTSRVQDETVQDCLPLLAAIHDPSRNLFDFNPHGLPWLEREKHVTYLHNCLKKLPAGFVVHDASRPWILYWVLAGLCLLGEDVQQYRTRFIALKRVQNASSQAWSANEPRYRVVQTLSPMQNLDGGFGGGHGQMSHCATSYAAILSLAMVGGKESLDMIDRRALWRWLGDLKQHDGGFVVCVGGEEDVRYVNRKSLGGPFQKPDVYSGAYCSMVLISLLALPLELPSSAPSRIHGLRSFLDGLPEYLSRCQTFEGGISGAPQNEAHGAYAFCALACLCILGPPHQMISKYLDVSILISWLSARQYAPEGGFAGRTNKLVDGCYSHWVGGCWPLLEAAINGPQPNEGLKNSFDSRSLFSREGLIRYILSCCQAENGGLRDKPLKPADAYHSCYSLAGLSAVQNQSYFPATADGAVGSLLDSALLWASLPEMPKAKKEEQEQVFDVEDRLTPIHPIYVIPWDKVEQTHVFFADKGGF